MQEKQELLSKKGFILDVDGVICRGSRPIEGGVEGVRALLEMGKRVVFVSNNSTRSRRMLICNSFIPQKGVWRTRRIHYWRRGACRGA